ncbi:hypothetical protein AVEN_111232-1 [Araneus ventricosus]|uniref:Tc1-like transposase DDE domain-containing protein n=1 Tax=Araneus ventricosus TaxID=182803 RepID=A0A4Y2EPT4_ARAVE|nr:hypothetical protein AVEN_111232-1 [Araneus ventricosus]
MQPLPLHSQKVTVWIVGPLFSRRLVIESCKTGTVNGTRYEFIFLRNQLIAELQQRGCVDSKIFMQNGTLQHIAIPVKQLFNLHFGNDKIISRHFPTAWPPRSPDFLRVLAVGLPRRCCVGLSACELI